MCGKHFSSLVDFSKNNVGECIYELEMGKYFLRQPQKANHKKEKIDKFDCIK